MSNEKLVFQPSVTTHWKNLFEKKTMLLGSHNLNPGEELVLQIASVSVRAIKGDKGREERVPVIQFNGAPPMVLNITNSTIIASLYGEYHDAWIGKYIQLFAAEINHKGVKKTALRVRPKMPNVGQDFSNEEAAIRSCKSMQELQSIYMNLPANVKSALVSVKDEMKAKL